MEFLAKRALTFNIARKNPFVIVCSVYYTFLVQMIVYLFPRTILLIKTTAAQNEDVLSYLRVRGLYYLAVVFVATIEVE